MIAATGGIGAYVHPHLVRDTYRGVRAMRLAGGGLVQYVAAPKRRVRKAAKTVRKTAKRVVRRARATGTKAVRGAVRAVNRQHIVRKARNTRNRVVKGMRAYY